MLQEFTTEEPYNKPQEFIFETVLFYKGTPCYYKIYLSENDYYGIPVPHHYYSKTDFPCFIVNVSHGQLQVKGITDETMVQTILSEFEMHLSLQMTST